jgi:glucose-specific phosphotransferase system IIA component
MNSLVCKAPLSGRTVPIEQVPDPVFAEKMMGEGIAIDPAVGEVRAPVDGRVEALFPTGHAVGIRTPDGVEILVHVGIESVSLTGLFQPAVSVGSEVKAGDLLIRFDLEGLRQKAVSPLTPVVVSALPDGLRLEFEPPGRDVTAGVETLFRVVR